MPSFKLIIQYKGTNYSGWQIQPAGKGQTIQGELHKVLAGITKSNSYKTLASGRTDAGVHALGQVVKIDMDLKIEPINLQKALNSLLPPDIQVLEIESCSELFHPIAQAEWKEYIYLFSISARPNSFQTDFIANYSWELDWELMNEACNLFVGKHDFKNFYTEGSDVKTTKRTILECELTAQPDHPFWGRVFPPIFQFRVKGTGFLKQMVRLMMGTLWEIGKEKVELDSLDAALNGKLEGKLGTVAKPQGLYLSKVHYPTET